MDLYKSCLILLVLAESGLCTGGQVVMPPQLTGVRGRSLNLTATITMSSINTIAWSFTDKSGTNLPIYSAQLNTVNVEDIYKDRVKYYQNTNTLEILSLLASDSGTYIVTVFDSKLQMNVGQTKLEVLEPVADVSITSTLTEAVEFNSTVVLECVAKGSSLSYVWLNNSVPVVADGKHIVQNGSQLFIKEVYRNDLKGPISCTAKNPMESSTSAPFNLTVNYGPDQVTLKQVPPAPFLKMGSNMTMSCSAMSSPAAEYIWLFNGAPLPQKDATVAFPALAKDQSGNYSCMAYNSKTLRYVTSQVTTLSVIEPISGTNVSAPMVPLIAGNSTVNLTCTCSKGKADSVQWQKNGKPLDGSQRIIFSTDKSTVSILTVQKEDAGEYTCQLQNEISSDSNKYNLLVNYGPDNVAIKGATEVLLGDSLTLNCSYDSYPAPTFVWKFNDTIMPLETRSCLIITNFEDNKIGYYTCEASNSVTELKKSATHNLKVKKVDNPKQEGLSSGAIAGIVIAVLVVLGILLCICIRRKKKSADIPSPY